MFAKSSHQNPSSKKGYAYSPTALPTWRPVLHQKEPDQRTNVYNTERVKMNGVESRGSILPFFRAKHGGLVRGGLSLQMREMATSTAVKCERVEGTLRRTVIHAFCYLSETAPFQVSTWSSSPLKFGFGKILTRHKIPQQKWENRQWTFLGGPSSCSAPPSSPVRIKGKTVIYGGLAP